ncbi:MAG TPA: hypothetical protein EYH26_02935 [Pyrodictium sp.]|nr:hypothetical protein [Pyrodictium sp.]HIQ10915.1 hypothetical protein [Pyrodictium sp.]
MATTHVPENTQVTHFLPTIDIGVQVVDAELETVIDELVYVASIYGFLDALDLDSIEARALFEEKAALFLKAIGYRYSKEIFKYLYSQKRWLPDIVNEFGEEKAKMLLHVIATTTNNAIMCTSDIEYGIDSLLTLLMEEEPKSLSCVEKAYLAALLLTTPPPEVTAT